MTKQLTENLEELNELDLPEHLRNKLAQHYRKADSYGLDPNFVVKARRQAARNNDDFHPAHGLL